VGLAPLLLRELLHDPIPSVPILLSSAELPSPVPPNPPTTLTKRRIRPRSATPPAPVRSIASVPPSRGESTGWAVAHPEIGRKNILGLIFLSPPPHPQQPSAGAVAARSQAEHRVALRLARHLPASVLPCQSLCSVAQRLPCSVPACRAAAVLLPVGRRRAPFSHSPATLPVRLPCHGAGLPATLPSDGLASTLPAWRGGASLPPCSMR
jgi:hypothetical protein